MWNDHLFMTRSGIREYDRIAIDELGIPGPVLMENAGRGATRIAAGMLAGRPGSVGILAGPGNNGGDGFVIARHLINQGVTVRTYLAVPRHKAKGDAALNLDILEKMGGDIRDVSDTPARELASPLKHHALIVDALLGTGVTREVSGLLGDLIDLLNTLCVPVLAVDIPSGLDSDTGRPWGRAVRAAATATFGHLKRGLVQYPGRGLAGAISVIPLGVPGEVSAECGVDGEVLSEETVRSLLPERATDAHKGTFGHLLVVGGFSGKTGAAAMAGASAMRAGAGLVTLATSFEAGPALEAKCLEVMVAPVIEEEAPPTEATALRIATALEGKRAVALGPGLSTGANATALTEQVLDALSVPAVVDADGLNILAANPALFEKTAVPMVLTPHPGEMARLVGKGTREVQANRIDISRAFAEERGVVLVLKGAGTVIAAPDGRVFVNPTGNAGMASGGMGDVLTGVIGGFLAQGLAPLDSARLGVYLHGLAGDRAVVRTGAAGLIASEVMFELQGILRDWETI